MCEPTLIAGLALSAAGSAFNARSQSKAAQAQQDQSNQAIQMANDAREAERKRQASLDNKSYAEVRSSMEDIAPDKRAELASAVAADPTSSVQAAASQYAPLPRQTTDSGEVLGDAGRLRDQVDQTKAMVDAMALLNAQGVGTQGVSDRLGRSRSRLASDNSQAQRSASVAGYEAAVPTPTVTPSKSILGDLMQVGGQLASGYGGGQMTSNPFSNWDLIGKKGAFSGKAVA